MSEEGKVSFESRWGDRVFGLISKSRILLIFSRETPLQSLNSKEDESPSCKTPMAVWKSEESWERAINSPIKNHQHATKIVKQQGNMLSNEKAIDDSEGPEAPPGFELFEVPVEEDKTLSENMKRLKKGRNKNKDKKTTTMLSPRKTGTRLESEDYSKVARQAWSISKDNGIATVSDETKVIKRITRSLVKKAEEQKNADNA
ncbi:hypothetical protein Cgig2_031106 [Carnegiea gigantea]|uniref:Uncharacterized protein n=1 Tax=Carnegiea gigantea TaxID=171969 RepID=A0A9Q1GRR4_9CARY|nr:hypothetical protein Cgig2_031106 [Carnegiea gigantea]